MNANLKITHAHNFGTSPKNSFLKNFTIKTKLCFNLSTGVSMQIWRSCSSRDQLHKMSGLPKSRCFQETSKGLLSREYLFLAIIRTNIILQDDILSSRIGVKKPNNCVSRHLTDRFSLSKLLHLSRRYSTGYS